ncbi:cell division protein FtsK [Actinomadura rubrisoli]|uniref:Cell division protein FtsK n=1 Tax=Actinomadura rubrisoli TaxID=2530368 RepID=A0A4R5AUP4_9ACTN|nr:cell division protein FtsK [Actinomadura rubrisoli]TDD75800.1 cell division protein FtsK [Actinomadura rubrisoli]
MRINGTSAPLAGVAQWPLPSDAADPDTIPEAALRTEDAAAPDMQDTSYAVTLDEPEKDTSDASEPALTGTVLRPAGDDTITEGARHPIIPPVFRDRVTFEAAVRKLVGRWLHITGYHAVRAPWYAVKMTGYAALGAAKLAGRQVRWWWLLEQEPLRQAAASRGDADLWLKLHREAARVRTGRGLAVLGEVVSIGAGGVLAAGSPWTVAGAIAVSVPLLARYGRPAGKNIAGQAVIPSRYRVITHDVVLRAYYAAGLGHPDKPQQQVQFAAPGLSADGDGSKVTVDLPYGKGFNDVIKAKDALASGLDVAISQVFVTRDATSHRRHTLWVANRDPLAVPVGRTPLLRCKPTDIWEPAPVGLDERGRAVTVPLLWNSTMVGAQPRQGKTFFARLLALYAALDPYVRLSVFDASGKPDWRKFALVAHQFSSGLVMTRDGDPVEILIEALRELKADVQDRYQRLSDLPTDVCPEGKLTREIARDPKYGMPVRGVFLDEFQEYYDTPDAEANKEIASLLLFLVKTAPAAGVFMVDATQKPSGIGAGQVATSFNSFRDNHQTRFSLRTGSWQVSDLVLGAGAYGEGLDSSLLLPSYKGVGILRGASDDTPTVRSHLADAEDAEKILLAARDLRERAGTLSGHAAGDRTARQVRDVLADAYAMFLPGESFLPWQELAARLADQLPASYGDLTAEAVSAQVRSFGVPSVNGKRDGQVLKGAKCDAITDALRARTP